ncbi:MAG: glycosyltransferase [Planctomycetes bacterium]|nr:glycosyltransferase [Planctomycetota bacterium]
MSGTTTRLLVDPYGRDPLVVAYRERFAATCAWHTMSWRWVAVGLAAGVAGATAAGLAFPPPAGAAEALGTSQPLLLAWFCRPWVAQVGIWLAAVAASCQGVLVGPHLGKRIPAGQEPFWGAALVAVAHLLVYDRLVCLAVVTAVLCAVYLGAIVFRLLALVAGGRPGHRQAGPLAEPEGGWPLFTVLVPLYREREVASNILRSLAALDYPRDRLDVKFLLEGDDQETYAAIEAAGIPDWAEVLVVPHAQPKTKPRACNHGLERARGEFTVIFDAEDRPESDQLKQAVLAFRKLPERTACLQAQLAYHNHAQNLLTRWFALEYNQWFRRYLRGLVRLRLPIPLGGTSNHFRTAALKEVGGWDPFNVTEDCDLGVRLHLKGQRTAILESVTWEEANSRVGNWLRQRSRWLKGYLISHLVWTRNPFRLLLVLGPWSLAGFLLCVGAVPVLAAANLVLWGYAAIYLVQIARDLAHGFPLWELLSTRDYAEERHSWPMWFQGNDEDPVFASLSRIFFMATCALLLGNLLFILVAATAGRRPGQRGLLLAALLSPLYWVLISLGAWKGVWQFLFKPHYWEKTVHGLDVKKPGPG